MWKHAMRALRVVVLLLVMVGRALSESEPITEVYILAGQSNAEGHNDAGLVTRD